MTGTALVHYDAARRALAEAVRVDEVKQIRDLAVAAQAYARQAQDVELINNATDIRARAERRAGELLAELKREGARHSGRGDQKSGSQSATPKLADIGVTKTQSSRWQAAAVLPDDEFEARVAAMKRKAVTSLSKVHTMAGKKQRREARERELAAQQLALPDIEFNVVVEDFEWDFQVYSRETGMDRHAANHYPISEDAHTAEEIVERTRERFTCAAEDCVLFMWVPVPFLAIGVDVLRLRGFRYVSNYAWGKDKIGTGHWNRNNHEHCLIGVRGDIPAPAPGTQRTSLIMAKVGVHSAKPECFLEMIEVYYPNLPKVELNRRGPPRARLARLGLRSRPG